MKKYFISLIMLCLINITFAQNEFNRVYQYCNQVNPRNIFNVDNGYAIFEFHDDSLGIKKALVLTMDSLGDIIEEKELPIDTNYFSIYKVTRVENNNYLIIGDIGTGNYQKDFIMKLDENYDTIFFKQLNLPQNDSLITRSLNVEIDYDGGYLLIGETNYLTGNNYTEPYTIIQLIKIDSLGNFLWKRTYFDNSKNTDQIGYYIKKFFGNGYVIGAWSVFNHEGDWEIINLDNNYNIKEIKYYGNPVLRDNRMVGMITTQDSCLLVTGKYSMYQTNAYTYYGLNRVLKLDTNLNTVFSNYYGDTTYFSGFGVPSELCSGNYLFMEQREGYITYYHKIAQNGDYLMEKHIPEYDSLNLNHICFDYTITEDNSAISIGYVWGWDTITSSSVHKMWNVKLNSIGDNNLCQPNNIISNSNNKFKIYPNPVKDYIIFENSNQRNNVEIFDIYGRKIMSKELNKINILNVSYLKQGIYFIKIDNNISKFVKE